jgi:hypothetical protein
MIKVNLFCSGRSFPLFLFSVYRSIFAPYSDPRILGIRPTVAEERVKVLLQSAFRGVTTIL